MESPKSDNSNAMSVYSKGCNMKCKQCGKILSHNIPHLSDGFCSHKCEVDAYYEKQKETKKEIQDNSFINKRFMEKK